MRIRIRIHNLGENFDIYLPDDGDLAEVAGRSRFNQRNVGGQTEPKIYKQ